MNRHRDIVWGLRLSRVEMDQIKQAGARFGLSPSAWARAVLMRSLLVDPRDTPPVGEYSEHHPV